jgi:hypothetical protein
MKFAIKFLRRQALAYCSRFDWLAIDACDAQQQSALRRAFSVPGEGGTDAMPNVTAWRVARTRSCSDLFLATANTDLWTPAYRKLDIENQTRAPALGKRMLL